MQRILMALVLGASFCVSSIGTAAADDQRIRLRGTISAVTNDTLTLASASGPATVALTPATKVAYVVKTDLSAIKPGSLVGTAAVAGPDGTLRAREVHIFPAGSPVNVGTGPWDTEPGATMTNAPVTTIGDATVDNVAAHTLTLTLPSGDKRIVVGPDTPIVTYAAADRKALTTGAHAIVFATKHDDGSITGASVNVGQNGLVPPM